MLFQLQRQLKSASIINYTKFIRSNYSIKPDIKLISKIRQETEVSITKAKESLIATNNDLKAALQWLEKDLISSGAKKAAKLADRVASEGLIGVAVQEKENKIVAAMAEVCCETDFVTRSPMFHQLVTSISETIVQNQLLETNFNTVKKLNLAEDTVKQLSVNNGESNVNELISENIAKLGENLILRRSLVSQFEIENQDKVLVATHAHNGIGNNGKIGGYIVIRVKGDVKDQVKLDKINKQLARHVVGLNPLYLSSNEEAVILKKDSMTAEEYQQYLNENVLLNQNFLFSNGTVLEFLKSIEKELNIKLEILTYSRLMAGEGVEKVETVDFRDEVMKQVEKFN